MSLQMFSVSCLGNCYMAMQRFMAITQLLGCWLLIVGAKFTSEFWAIAGD